MENRTSRHISEHELDGLLKETFLGLDFESNQTNKKALEAVATHTLRKNALSRMFSSKRLNFILLVVSAFIFLNSFYRYLEPLINKDNKKHEPILGISTLKKEEVPAREEAKVLAIQKATETKETSSVKKKKRLQRKNQAEIKPVVALETEKKDSVLFSQAINSISDSTKVVAKTAEVEPDAPQIKVSSPPVKSTTAKINPERKVTQKVSSKKGKTPKVRKHSIFRRNGTFILKGGRYGKSRKIQR